MKDILPLQKEFEELVKQLNNFKTINELSSANTENTAKLTTKTDEFILSVIEFQKKLETHYQKKEKQLDKSINTFNKALDKSEVSIQEQQEKFSKSVVSTQEKSWEVTQSKIQELNDSILRFLNETKDVKSGFKKNVDDFILEFTVNLEEIRSIILGELKSLEKLSLLDTILQKLGNQNDLINKSHEDINSRMDKIENMFIKQSKKQSIMHITTWMILLLGGVLGGIIVWKFIL